MASSEKIEIKLLPDECWWGGVVRHGDQMPFDANTNYRAELGANLWGNQGCPLLVSSKGRYIWSEEPYSFEFDTGVLTLEDILGEIEQGDGHENLRGAYLAACGKFFPPSGKIPPERSFIVPQYNAWIDMLYYPTQEKVLSYAQAILDAGMPPGVLIIDDWWYKHPSVWRFDREAFPEPREMIDSLHEQGFLVMLWVNDFAGTDMQEFMTLRDKGFLFSDEDGQPIIRKWWNGYSALVDLSNPDAFAWVQDQLDVLVDEYGIDGFKFDSGDVWTYRFVERSYAPRTINGHAEDFCRLGLKYDLSEFRGCWKMGGLHFIQRVRDKHHRWDEGGMADVIPTSLAQGLVGYPYTCPDMVGGGEDTSFTDPDFQFDQELFVRWAQCSTFFPIIQYSNLPDRVLDKEHLAYCMEMIELRKKIGPEVLELAKHAAKTGEPIMRNMAYNFPDEGMERILDQYMLGDKYLIAPVMVKGAVTKKVKFPAGTWKGDDGHAVDGPCELEVPAPLSRLPWYTRME